MTVPAASQHCRLTAVAARARLQDGSLSAAQFAASCTDRVLERDPFVRAWAYMDPEQISRSAHALDQAPRHGRLHGIPVGVKDVILTADMPTGYNTPLPEPSSPRVDAACMAALRTAGALIFGKTDTVEFAATGRRARTCNPHDLARTPGGSSSGSAAAVADFHVPIALGTQTGGSIIRPASFCGVYGFKPSWSLVDTEGIRSFAPSLDTFGWFARSSQDIALVMEIFAPKRLSAGLVAPPRIAVCRDFHWNKATPATRLAMIAAIQRFRDIGASVVELTLPPSIIELPAAQLMIMRAEGGQTFLPIYRQHGEAVHINLKNMVRKRSHLNEGDLQHAYDLAAHCRVAFDEIAAAFDAILVPSTPGEAPHSLLGTGDLLFNGAWTLLHVPCLNVPGFYTANGMPVGVTLTGARGSDWRVLEVANLLR